MSLDDISDHLIESVRAGLTTENTQGDKIIYSVNGPGIDMDLVGGCKTWVVMASSPQEARFIVFSLKTEFFKDLVSNKSAVKNYDSFVDFVLSIQDGSCWGTDKAIGNRIFTNTS